MRKWLVPLMVVGAGGLGAFFLTDKGRAALRRWKSYLDEAPEHWEEWNDGAQVELQRIQSTLNQIAHSLEPHGQAGH
jgi:DNA-binding PadR family transcriptional regulator